MREWSLGAGVICETCSMEHGSAGLSGAGSWADQISWCGPRPGIAVLHHERRERRGEVTTRHRGLVTSDWGPSSVTGYAASWSVDTERGILIIRAQSALSWVSLCLRSQLRNKHVFCKEGQITWLTLLGVRLCISRCMLLGVTRSSQQTRHIIIPGRCINSAGFIAKPPLLSLFA